MLMSVSGGSAESGCMIVGLKCHICSQLVANLAATCSVSLVHFSLVRLGYLLVPSQRPHH